MSEVVDKHAPQKTKRIKIVSNAPWFDVEYNELRRRRRKAEKQFKKTGLEVHKEEFVQLRKQTTNLAFNKKRKHFTIKIDECGKNSKSLFACVNNLLDIRQNVVLPSHDSGEELAGINGVALAWFKSFLIGRTQKVKVGDSYSSIDPLKYGVPQGSVMGPRLFNIYIRSFPEKVHSAGFEAEGFADDHQLRRQFNPIFQIKALGENIDRCFQVISEWMTRFFLRLNSSKTKILVVAPPSIKSEILINGTFINGTCIRFVDSAKNLGIIMDSELSFDIQIQKLVSSCFYTIRCISRIKYFLNENQIKTLVSSLVFSKIDYCNALYHGLNTKLIKKLQVVQNSAVRLIYNIHRYDRLPVSNLFTKLHWLKVKERITFKLLLIVHKCFIGIAPPDVIALVSPSNSDRTRKLEIYPSNGTYGDRSFSVLGPKLWNALPRHICAEASTENFKKSLKTFLLTKSDSYFQVVNMK